MSPLEPYPIHPHILTLKKGVGGYIVSLVSSFLMAIALSLDGFGVGLTYGLRRIRIPLASLVVIALCTVVAMGMSMLFGHWLVRWLTIIPTRIFGAVILMGLGGFQLIQALRRHTQVSEASFGTEEDEEELAPVMATVDATAMLEPVLNINLRALGLVVQVLRTPDLADVDRSGGISLKESFLLGSALAMDAFASGMGAAMTGMGLSVIVVVALTQLAMLRLGQELAGRIPREFLVRADLLPGAVLILVGLGKLV